MEKKEYVAKTRIADFEFDMKISNLVIHTGNVKNAVIKHSGTLDIKEEPYRLVVSEKLENNVSKKNSPKRNVIISNNICIVNYFGGTIINGNFASQGEDSVELIIPDHRDSLVPVENDNLTIIVNLVNGDLRINGLNCMQLIAETMSGDLIIDNLNGTNVRAKTMSGDIILKNFDAISSNIESMSGDVNIEVSESMLNYKTSLKTISGDAKQSTVESDVPNILADKHKMNVKTVSGEVKVLFKGKQNKY